ncbi:MAG TPA: hypothetical protein VMV70_08795 [Gallionella sp.]|nr:hypothetical protein [Gallionella sp.]
MNLLSDQYDGTASHSPWLPHNGNQGAGYVVLRARAILEGLSRGSFRRSLHLDLLVTVLARVTMVLVALLCLSNIASAAESNGSVAGSYGMPKLDIGKGGHCVAPPEWMRINHMKVLFKQRDETVHQGIRAGGKYSLENCVECHASLSDNSVIGRPDSFCEGCHRYEAVKIDCFECHSSKRSVALVQEVPK